ncbi:MAG: hypothetical protein KDA72_08245, partial [Planctomycetales bacterium]|nr:hypothetical protein [Planctomycetales bacterium]
MSSSTSNPENRKVGSRVLSRWATHSREWALVGMILCVTILFSILYPYSFCSWANFNAVLRNLAFE